jgi:hypothetical protein
LIYIAPCGLLSGGLVRRRELDLCERSPAAYLCLTWSVAHRFNVLKRLLLPALIHYVLKILLADVRVNVRAPRTSVQRSL